MLHQLSFLSAKAVRTPGGASGFSLRDAGPAILAGLLLTAGCNGGGGSGDGVGSTLTIGMTFGAPAPTGQNVAWIDGSISAGELQTVEIRARDITLPFDGYGLEIGFDPSIARIVSVRSGGLLASCSGLTTLFVADVAAANDTGTLLVAEALPGNPPGCTFTGSASLAVIVFRAQNAGTSNLSMPACAGSDPDTATGSCFYGRTAAGATLVPVNATDHRSAALSVTSS